MMEMGKRRGTGTGAFLNGEGKIRQLPVPARTKLPVLAYLAGKFEGERIYKEKEVNAVIDAWHTFGDYFLLRRLLVDHGFMARKPDGSAYWLLAGKEETKDWTEKKS